MSQPGLVTNIGQIEYKQAFHLQERVCRAVEAGVCPDVLLLLKHPPVFTIGRGGGRDHLLVSKEELSQESIALFDTGVTSLSRLLGRPVASEEVRGRLAGKFAEIFGLSFGEVSLQQLQATCPR